MQSYYIKVSQPCFPPSTSLASVYLAAALKRFHENSEAEQVGVVAPGVGTAKHDEDGTQEGFLLSGPLQPISIARQSLSRHVLHTYKMINSAVHIQPHT